MSRKEPDHHQPADRPTDQPNHHHGPTRGAKAQERQRARPPGPAKPNPPATHAHPSPRQTQPTSPPPSTQHRPPPTQTTQQDPTPKRPPKPKKQSADNPGTVYDPSPQASPRATAYRWRYGGLGTPGPEDQTPWWWPMFTGYRGVADVPTPLA